MINFRSIVGKVVTSKDISRVELDFGALTIDNAVLKGEGYRFYDGLLYQMVQFRTSPIRVAQTDIVHNEAIKHMGSEITRARSSINQALRSAKKQLHISDENIEAARALLDSMDDEKSICENRLLKYYGLIGAEVIESDKYLDISKLLAKYFSTTAPFEKSKDKKNEFPDAIALLSLEAWGEENKINVLAVSQDIGWKDFAESSNRITVVSTLPEALEILQPHSQVVSIMGQIIEDSMLQEDNHILDSIESNLISSVENYEVAVTASSYLYFEWDNVSISYISHELDCDEHGEVVVNVVSISGGVVVLKLSATVDVEVEADFSFYMKDFVDDSYMNLVNTTHTAKEKYNTAILLTLTGDFSQDFKNLNVDRVEVLETLQEANFGDVEPM
ncbi:DUF4935 domain-containing protein [Cobetia sp. UIB-001]|uniref:PIN domain-containing protein n=1 Tax=Cobetia sp. UIB-001 TaxID=2717697 RepID=UPI00384E81C2